MIRLPLLILILLSSVQFSCEGQSSSRPKVEFSASINTEVKLGLHIIPVQLRGKTYRFLFDTGAPTSISEELQENLKYKVTDREYITDSDKNKIRVNYVKVDSIVVGGIKFGNVRAFVADFTANPTLGCLQLDGILGSNMMQACNWQIDYVNEQIDLSSDPFLTNETNISSVGFKADKQYNILVNMKMGRAKVSNMKIDYGNNSSISIPQKVLKVLLEENIVDKSFKEKGFNQGGIGANPVAMTRYYAYLDSLMIGDLLSTDLTLKTGNSGLVGRDFLSRYIVAINWNEKKLRFKTQDSWADSRPTFGYKIGINKQDEPVLFGVVEDSEAAKAGLSVGMRVLKIDTLDFRRGSTYCDYISFAEGVKNTISIVVQEESGFAQTVVLGRRLLNRN